MGGLSSDVVLHKCVVCAKVWPSAQSLRAHLKVHRHEGYMRSAIVVRRDDWEKFKEICRRHNTTTCQYLGSLLQAAIKGEELGVVTVGGPNPPIIQVQNYFLSRPRSGWKVPIDLGFVPQFPAAQHCHLCGSPAAFKAWFKPATATWRPRFLCAGCLEKNREYVKVSARL